MPLQQLPTSIKKKAAVPQIAEPNRTRQPMLWAALAFACGIVAGHYSWRPPTWWMTSTLVFAGAAAYLAATRAEQKASTGRLAVKGPHASPAASPSTWSQLWRPTLAKFFSLAAVACLGALNLQLRTGPEPEATRILDFANGQETNIVAHVISEGKIRKASYGGIAQQVDLETEEIHSGGRALPIRAGIRLSLYSKKSAGDNQAQASESPLRMLTYGERVRVPCKLRAPRNFRNPGAFDYVGYLAENGITVLGSARADELEVLPGFMGGRLRLWRAHLHRSILTKIHQLWPAEQAALIDAMVIGDSAFIERDSKVDFQRSGTYHILVVSGMNVGILAAVVFWLLRRLRVSEITSSITTVLLAVAYAFLTDVGAPVWRAVLMMTVYLAARWLYRDRCMLNALGAAGLTLMVLDPQMLLGASFQLTFLSVLIMAAACVPVLERTSEPYRRGLRFIDSVAYDSHLLPRVAQLRLDVRMIGGRITRFIRGRAPLRFLLGAMRAGLSALEIVFVSAVMQIGLALPMAFYFHRATVIGVPSNTLAIPLTGILMPAALVAVGSGCVSMRLAKLPALVTAAALNGITGGIRALGRISLADLRVATPTLTITLVGAAALALALVLARRSVRIACLSLVGLAAAAIWIAQSPAVPLLRAGALEVTVIDVGQGDATLLITPDGKTLLVDSGGPVGGQHSELDFGEDVVSPYLWSRGFSRLDAVAITHGHSDHIGGMHAILNNFRPAEAWISALPDDSDEARLIAYAKTLGMAVRPYFAGDSFSFGGTSVRVLSPAPGYKSLTQPKNNDSMVLHIRFGETSVLLEADAEKGVERNLASEEPRADLIRIAHNGSTTSSTPIFLEAVEPKWAVISVGARSTFGHPRKEVLERLERMHVRTYRTDLDGAVTFYLDGTSVSPALAVPR